MDQPVRQFRWRTAVPTVVAVGLAGLTTTLTGCHSTPEMSYARDVYPILEQNCEPCHSPPDGEGYTTVGLDIRSYEGLMYGTYYGAVIVPGDSRHSILNMAGEGRIHMNSRELKDSILLSDEEMKVLRNWVDQGARDN